MVSLSCLHLVCCVEEWFSTSRYYSFVRLFDYKEYLVLLRTCGVKDLDFVDEIDFHMGPPLLKWRHTARLGGINLRGLET